MILGDGVSGSIQHREIFMHLESKTFTCKNGKELLISSIGPAYAEEYLRYMKLVSDETSYMSRYGDEISLSQNDIAAEQKSQGVLADDEGQGMISIFDKDRIIGNIAIRRTGKGRKTAHRCSVGLAVVKEFQGCGLGTVLMEAAINFAKDAGYEYMELGVVSGNAPARGLYKKMGFVESGCLPDAFRLDDGESFDEITMYKKL